MKKLQKIVLVLLSAALIAWGALSFVSCANDSSNDSTSEAQNENTENETTKTITINGTDYVYKTTEDETVKTDENSNVSVDTDGNITITADNNSKVIIKKDGTIEYIDANGKKYTGTLSENGIELSDGNGSTITAEVANNTYFFAEAINEGIKFTIKTLPANKRANAWLGIYDENGCAIIPKWNNKSQDWTGFYPFISSGETRTFTLYTSFDVTETQTITATGGSGSITIADNLKSTLTVSNDKITVNVPEDYSHHGFPQGTNYVRLMLEICTSDGNSFGYADFDWDETNLEISGDNYNNIKNTWKSTYSDKEIHADVFHKVGFDNSPDEYRIKAIPSDNQTPTAWQD